MYTIDAKNAIESLCTIWFDNSNEDTFEWNEQYIHVLKNEIEKVKKDIILKYWICEIKVCEFWWKRYDELY